MTLGARPFVRRTALALATLLPVQAAQAAGVGRRFPPEKRSLTDSITGLPLTFLTTDPANDGKPYQTDTTWTADDRPNISEGLATRV